MRAARLRATLLISARPRFDDADAALYHATMPLIMRRQNEYANSAGAAWRRHAAACFCRR